MTGDGHGGQPFGCQPFSLQPPEPGCQLPMAEWPTPEFPMPVPVTRHHVFLTLPILNTPYSILSYPTFALHLWSSRPRFRLLLLRRRNLLKRMFLEKFVGHVEVDAILGGFADLLHGVGRDEFAVVTEGEAHVAEHGSGFLVVE